MLKLRALTVLLVLLVCASACDRAKQLWSEASGEQDTEQAELERKLELERERVELAKLEAERRERERVAAETRRRELQAADALISAWIDQLEANKAEDGSFLAHEGLSEDDPWGTQLRVRYGEVEGDSQTLEVRSAGPDLAFDNDDDLVRARTTQIERSLFERYKWWALGAFLWFGGGFISAGGLVRRRHRKRGEPDAGLDVQDILLSVLHITFAPISVLFWGALLIFEVFAEILD